MDVACGVRLLAADLSRTELPPVLGRVMDRLAAVIPCGAGRGGLWELRGRAELDKLLAGGPGYALACGHGEQRDLDRCEDHSLAKDADPALVSSRAADRGRHQVGSLGSGNHFLEVQAVEEVFDPAAAQAFGLAEGQVCVMVHCGSRGLGHQVCADQVQIMGQAMARYGSTVPGRQLACAPAGSPEGRRYLGAMAAANYARANRQLPVCASPVRVIAGEPNCRLAARTGNGPGWNPGSERQELPRPASEPPISRAAAAHAPAPLPPAWPVTVVRPYRCYLALSAYLSGHGSMIDGNAVFVTGYPGRLPGFEDHEDIRGSMQDAVSEWPMAARRRFRGGYHGA